MDVTRIRNIIITGFMATGKTTVGQLVADYIGWRFVDSDEEIVRRVGMSISDIFVQDGEEGFRRYERIVCQTLAAGHKQVIATGGGMLVDDTNRGVMLASGLVVCLTASPDEIRARLVNFARRPLASNWEQLLESRQAAYAAIPYQIDTTGLTPEAVSEKVIVLCRTVSR